MNWYLVEISNHGNDWYTEKIENVERYTRKGKLVVKRSDFTLEDKEKVKEYLESRYYKMDSSDKQNLVEVFAVYSDHLEDDEDFPDIDNAIVQIALKRIP